MRARVYNCEKICIKTNEFWLTTTSCRVRSIQRKLAKINRGTIRSKDRARASGRSRARTRPRVLTASTQTNLKASTTAQHHVHAHPAVGITSTEPGRKARPCKPGGRARPREIFETKTRLRLSQQEIPTRINAWFAIIAVPIRIVPEIRDAQSIARCARHQDIDRNLARARFASAANARQSAIRHANVHQSMHALTVALQRIEPAAATAQITARCAKHPVIDKSLARVHSVSVASANKSDTRLENAKSKATAPLGMMSTMAEILWMMLTIKMPTPAR